VGRGVGYVIKVDAEVEVDAGCCYGEDAGGVSVFAVLNAIENEERDRRKLWVRVGLK
jgi:hypothetical protein